MKALKKFTAAFAAGALGATALPATAQDAPAAPPAEAPAQGQSVERPALAPDFKLADYVDTKHRDKFFGCSDLTQSCWTPEEQQAARVRELQMVFMAGALACVKSPNNSDLFDRYNDFVTNNQKMLESNYFVARGRFNALNAGQPRPERAAMIAHDQLDTANANIYSNISSRDGMCNNMSALLREFSAVTDAQTVIDAANRLIPPAHVPTPAAPTVAPTVAPPAPPSA